MSDIILVYPPVTLRGRYSEVAIGHEVPPQPLIYLAAVLRKNGYSVEIIDANAIGWFSKNVRNGNSKMPRLKTIMCYFRMIIKETFRKRRIDVPMAKKS